MFEIHCANCGCLFPFDRRWFNSLAKLAVCGKKCNDELSKKYASMIIGQK